VLAQPARGLAQIVAMVVPDASSVIKGISAKLAVHEAQAPVQAGRLVDVLGLPPFIALGEETAYQFVGRDPGKERIGVVGVVGKYVAKGAHGPCVRRHAHPLQL